MGTRVGAGTGDLVFVSYSHKDQTWLQRFLIMLKPLVRDGSLEVWADPYLDVGGRWRRDIAAAIDRSTLALLLVSADSLASDFIMEEELPALLARGVRVVWVLVRPCLWRVTKVLRDLQCSHDLALALSQLPDSEAAIVQICLKVASFLPATATPEIDVATPATPAGLLAAAFTPGRLDGVPALPKAYVKREDLAWLKAALKLPCIKRMVFGDSRG